MTDFTRSPTFIENLKEMVGVYNFCPVKHANMNNVGVAVAYGDSSAMQLKYQTNVGVVTELLSIPYQITDLH